MNSAFVGYEELSRSRRVLSTSADNTLLDLLNSSYPTQPHSLISNYHTKVENRNGFIIHLKYFQALYISFNFLKYVCLFQNISGCLLSWNHLFDGIFPKQPRFRANIASVNLVSRRIFPFPRSPLGTPGSMAYYLAPANTETRAFLESRSAKVSSTY